MTTQAYRHLYWKLSNPDDKDKRTSQGAGEVRKAIEAGAALSTVRKTVKPHWGHSKGVEDLYEALGVEVPTPKARKAKAA